MKGLYHFLIQNLFLFLVVAAKACIFIDKDQIAQLHQFRRKYTGISIHTGIALCGDGVFADIIKIDTNLYILMLVPWNTELHAVAVKQIVRIQLFH